MLSEILGNKKCFKLVCGAGNEDTEEVEKLVYVYSKAGANIFDLSANLEVIHAAKNGLAKSGIVEDRYLCVSVGIKGDPHIDKAIINENLCKKCDACKKICPQNAILEDIKSNYVKRKRCIGCGKCLKVCKHGAIITETCEKDLKEILPDIINEGIDCLELHAIVEDDFEVTEKWEILNELYNGYLSICIDRAKLGNKQILNRISHMLAIRKPYTTIIQADGAPMSGGDDDYKTTLQAVATGEIIQEAEFPAYMLLSGGTNSKTIELASKCGVFPSGIAIGTYARQIVRDFISRPDFWSNEEIRTQAIEKAKELTNTVINNMNFVI